MARIAAMVAEKANRAKRAPTFVLPGRGWSSVDAPGKPFYNPEVNQVFVSGLRSLLGKHVRVVEVDANINDEECARVAVEEFHRQFQRKP
jgi:uncharacterized protein (UPF0261 family)